MIDPRQYIYVILNRIWVLLGIVACVVLSTILFTWLQTPIYCASTVINLEPQSSHSYESIETMPVSFLRLNTQLEVMRSYEFVKKVFEICGLANDSRFTGRGDPIKAFQQCISVKPLPNTNLVELSVNGPDPEAVVHQANILAKTYIQHSMEYRKEKIDDAFAWLSDEVANLAVELERSEVALLQYKEKENIISLEKRQAFVEEGLNDLNKSYINANTSLFELKTRLQEIEKLEQQPEMAEYLPQLIESGIIHKLKEEYSDLEIQLAQFSTKYKPRHPRMMSLSHQMESIRDRLALELSKIVKSIEIECRISMAQRDAIKENLDAQKRLSAQMARQAIEYSEFKRKAENNRAKYNVFLQRLNHVDIGESTPANNVWVVEEARGPLSPVKPNKKKNVLMALLVGLSLGLGFCFLLEYLDNTIADEEDIKTYLNESLVGFVPKEKGDISVKIGDPKLLNQSYQYIKTAINLHKQEHVLKTMLVTSSIRDEGKTTSTVFLGIAFAQSGSKVLIIDADLFRPSAGKLLEVKNNVGLSDFFLHKKKVDEIIMETDIPNLFLIPGGLILPNPTEFISSEKMKDLIETVKSDFDIVRNHLAL